MSNHALRIVYLTTDGQKVYPPAGTPVWPAGFEHTLYSGNAPEIYETTYRILPGGDVYTPNTPDSKQNVKSDVILPVEITHQMKVPVANRQGR